MSPREAFIRTFDDVCGNVDIFESSYDDLSRVVQQWIEFSEEWSNVGTTGETASPRPLDQLVKYFAKRDIAAFRARVDAKSPLASAFLELFLVARIRCHVLAYLSIQECEDFEGSDRGEHRTPLFISQFLRQVGTRSNVSLRFGFWRFRLAVDIDPLVHLRAMYSLHMLAFKQRRRPSRPERLVFAWHRTGLFSKATVLSLIVRLGSKWFANKDPRTCILWLLRRSDFRKGLATIIWVMFPSAQKLLEADWTELLVRVEEYFTPRLVALFEVMPEHSIANHGLVKLCKIAFGTIHKRTQVRTCHEPNEIDFIFNTLRLAYSWGITYPLVDNVLDSDKTTPELRGDLVTVLHDVFNAGDEPAFPEPGPRCEFAVVREVRDRLAEAVSLVPACRRAHARKTLGLLLVAHSRDAQRRLSAPQVDLEKLRMAVMVDSALKAALIRLATIQIAGIQLDQTTTVRHLTHSLFNQLGDDIWDVYEDYADDRVTAYTLFLTCGGGRNPFDFYYDYLSMLARDQSKRRQTAIQMGFCETFRDALNSVETLPDDPLKLTDAISDTVRRLAGPAIYELVYSIPHVDTDAALFAFESALLNIVKRRPQLD